MEIKRIGLLLVIIFDCLSVDQKCTPSTVCPGQSYCDTNQAFCVCNSGFIGNCDITAPIISNTMTNFTISANQELMFSINPEKLNICTDVEQLSLEVILWIQTGQITNFTSTNGLTSLSPFTVGSSECLTLLSPFIKLQQQPNGQNQLIILGVTDTSSLGEANIQIGVSQQIVQGFIIQYYLIIGISILIVILIVLTVVYVICKKRRRNIARQNMEKKQSEYNDIQFFKDYMPLFNAIQLLNDRPICPICLQQIETVEVVRKTPCNHIFHSNCIDSWCLKTLNCPVCRLDLSLQALAEKVSRRNTQISQKIQNNTYVVNWQESNNEPPNIQISIDNKYQIRQSML